MPPPMSHVKKGARSRPAVLARSPSTSAGSQSRAQYGRRPFAAALQPNPPQRRNPWRTGAQREKKHRQGLGMSALHCGLAPRHETPSSVWFNASDSQRGVSRIPSPFFRGASATEKGLASLSAKPFMLLVEPTGIEPVTSTMPL
jgi:hypothetical protein